MPPEAGATGAAAEHDAVLRALRELWAGRGAHADLETALEGLPAADRARRPEGMPYSVWELVEHLRISQEDLVAYTLDASHPTPSWPDGYWPARRDEVDDATWRESVNGLLRSLDAMEAWLHDPEFDLMADIPGSDPLPSGGRRTPYRQMLIAADHRAYHLGQIVTLRRALGNW